ncbi:MAG: glycosyltransferase family A protein [Halospina sp.]
MSGDRQGGEKPLVSLILVTANRAEWLGDILDAIQAQQEDHWELIAVDCGSQDNTFEVLEAYAAADTRVQAQSIEETDKAIGRRQALSKARGQYLAFPDPNSLWSPDFLTQLLKKFEQSPENTGVTCAPSDVLGSGDEVRWTLPGDLRHQTMVRDLFEKPQLVLSALLLRRNVLKPLEKTGMRFWLSNDHALLIWLACKTTLERCERTSLVRVRPIEGQYPAYLDPVSEARGEALEHALENLPRVVPSRFARRCLAGFYRGRSVSLVVDGGTGDALGCALRALMYRPMWPRAWKQLLSIAVKG